MLDSSIADVCGELLQSSKLCRLKTEGSIETPKISKENADDDVYHFPPSLIASFEVPSPLGF
jgi:hypothetical protein